MVVRWLAAVIGVIALSGASLAQERVRLLTPLPGDLEARVEGQTSDLAWAIERHPGVARDLDEAQAASGGARVVVWVSRTSRGTRLHFADVPARRLLVRDFDAGSGEELESSAALESLAVALRSALVALSLGGEVGVVVAAPEAPPVAEPRPGPHVGLEASLGWALSLDGESPAQHGPSLGLALRVGRLAVGVRAELGLGASLDDALSALRVTRHAAALELGGTLLATPPLALDASARIGLARYRRGEVEARDADVLPSPPSASWSVLAGGTLAATFAPLARASVRVELGADFVPAAPELRYERGGESLIRNDLWRLQPRAALLLVIRSRP
ncbi:MAG: hypothetical protein KF901_02105 [Myxococcales bacterium]|nr:hypothetical protein [Myxococcales bacterium]